MDNTKLKGNIVESLDRLYARFDKFEDKLNTHIEDGAGFNARIETTLNQILNQVEKTNGRVTVSEKDITEIKRQRAYAKGKMASISFGVASIVSIIVAYIKAKIL